MDFTWILNSKMPPKILPKTLQKRKEKKQEKNEQKTTPQKPVSAKEREARFFSQTFSNFNKNPPENIPNPFKTFPKSPTSIEYPPQTLGFILSSVWLHFELILASFWLRFGSILAPFWPHFGSILAPFASPEGSRGQGHEMSTKCLDFGIPRASHLEAFLAQKTIKN